MLFWRAAAAAPALRNSPPRGSAAHLFAGDAIDLGDERLVVGVDDLALVAALAQQRVVGHLARVGDAERQGAIALHGVRPAHVERVLRDMDLREGAAVAKVLGAPRHELLALQVGRDLLDALARLLRRSRGHRAHVVLRGSGQLRQERRHAARPLLGGLLLRCAAVCARCGASWRSSLSSFKRTGLSACGGLAEQRALVCPR